MDKSAFTPFEVLTSGGFVCCFRLERDAYSNRLISSYDGGFVRTALQHLVSFVGDRSGTPEWNYS